MFTLLSQRSNPTAAFPKGNALFFSFQLRRREWSRRGRGARPRSAGGRLPGARVAEPAAEEGELPLQVGLGL